MFLLDGHPTGSVVILATLHISIREYDDSIHEGVYPPPFWRDFPEKVLWRMHATIFDLDLDPIATIDHLLSKLLFTWPGRATGSSDFETRFFSDAPHSCDRIVEDHQHIPVAMQCLTFLTYWTFPYPSLFMSRSRSKTHPWLTRRRKRLPGLGIPHVNTKLQTMLAQEATPCPSVQLLLSLRLALFYLPALLHNAAYSYELAELAKCWRDRGYQHHLFPKWSLRAGKAVNKYLLRVGGINGYATPSCSIFNLRS